MRRLNDEDGVVAVLFGIVVVVVFGFAAFAVDFGGLYEERRELQNGADAGAMAAAQECVNTGICDTTAHDATADAYSDYNARDTAAPCDPTSALCRGASFGDVVSVADQQLTVRSTTEDARNANGPLRHWFAGVLGHPESTLWAEATVSWGPPSPGTLMGTLPLALSNCDVERVMALQGGSLQYPPFPAGGHIIKFHNADGNPDTCSAQPGFDASYDSDADGKLPAGFSWLKDNPDQSCIVEVMTGDASDINPETGMPYDYVIKDPGNNVPQGCSFQLYKRYLVPVFKDFINSNPDDYYRIKSYVGFYLTGYKFPSMTSPPGMSCGGGGSTCIRGFLTTAPALAETYTPGAPCSVCVIGFES